MYAHAGGAIAPAFSAAPIADGLKTSFSVGFANGEIAPPSDIETVSTVSSPPGTPLEADRVPPPLRVVRAKPCPAVAPPPALASVSMTSIDQQFADVLADVDVDSCEANGENAFFVCDLAEVYRQAVRWQTTFGGRVDAFYAVKCNPDAHVIRLLARLGLGFDCASHAEISMVRSLGVAPEKIIYANPCKAGSFIRHAANAGVRAMTFDNADELNKVARFHPHAQMVLRILTDDEGSLCRFGDKFGAPLSAVRGLLEHARSLKVDVIGVSFHVGSGCTRPDLYYDAISNANDVFTTAREVGFNFSLLDIGGGFSSETLDPIAEHVHRAIDAFFPRERGVRIIAEPGRYFVTDAFELATNIIALRVPPTAATADDVPPMLYINDGVYGAFNCIMFDHQAPTPRVLARAGDIVARDTVFSDTDLGPCSIWGPSCDSIDVVARREERLPAPTLGVGDWLAWPHMGAYTICAASQFNGFRISEVRYTIDTHGDSAAAAAVAALVA